MEGAEKASTRVCMDIAAPNPTSDNQVITWESSELAAT